MSAAVSFTIPGAPVPKARPRVVRGHAFTPKRTRSYERKVRRCARAAGVRPLAGPVSLALEVWPADHHRMDIDNIAKAVSDALNGLAYDDDSQVDLLTVRRRAPSNTPRVLVSVGALDPDPEVSK